MGRLTVPLPAGAVTEGDLAPPFRSSPHTVEPAVLVYGRFWIRISPVRESPAAVTSHHASPPTSQYLAPFQKSKVCSDISEFFKTSMSQRSDTCGIGPMRRRALLPGAPPHPSRLAPHRARWANPF